MNNHLETIPPWAAVIIAILLIIGASLALMGNIGLIRFRSGAPFVARCGSCPSRIQVDP